MRKNFIETLQKYFKGNIAKHKANVNNLLDNSVALAEHVSGSDISFAALMNQHAENLGMNNTYFVNSSGMPVEGGGNYTTAHDLAILSQALIREHPEIYKLHVIKEYTY